MYQEAMSTSKKCRWSGDITPSKMLGTSVQGYLSNKTTKERAKNYEELLTAVIKI